MKTIVAHASSITKYIYNHCYPLYLMRKFTKGHEILRPAQTRFVSLREMGDYQTTRLLVCCALDRIWSSMKRLKDLDWFGPEMPYIQYGGWCSRSIALEPGCSKFRGELTSWSSSAGSRESNHFLRGGLSLL